MIRNRHLVRKLERDLLTSLKCDWERNLDLLEAMLEEAKYLHILPPKNPMEGIEVDITMARFLNRV